MCYSIPGKVENIQKNIVTVDYFGEKKKAINEIDDLKIGDYIYAQGGYVIKNIPQEEAFSILSVWKETFFELQEVDLQLSRLEVEKKGISKNLLKILDNAVEEKKLNDEQLLYLLELENADELNILYKTANFLRHKHLGNSCCVHGILEFSNYCKRNCFYCGISNHNASIERYRMTKEEILKNAEKAVNELSFQTLVLQCGEDSGFDIDSLVDLIKEIKSRLQVLIFISVGEIGLKELELLYEAGARGLLMRFETSNSSLYQKLHPNYSLQNRISHIEKAYKLGYLVITGSLIGLPDQTDLDLLNDIKLAKSLNAEMYSFGPFIPHPFTPLKNFNSPKVTKILKVLALTRILDPQNAKILVTSAFETIEPEARKLGLMAGANSIMLNATPKEYKKHYQIYPGRVYNDIDIKEQIDGTISMLRSLGRSPTDL